MEEMEKESADSKVNMQQDAKEKAVVDKESIEKKAEDVENAAKKTNKKDPSLQDINRAEDVKENKKTKETEEKDADEKQVEREENNKEDEEKSKKEKLGISPQELHKMLSADFELQKERVLGQVTDKKDGVENVLRAEIKSDTIQGTDTNAKEEKLAQLREQKPIQIDVIESGKREEVLKPENGMKIVIK